MHARAPHTAVKRHPAAAMVRRSYVDVAGRADQGVHAWSALCVQQTYVASMTVNVCPAVSPSFRGARASGGSSKGLRPSLSRCTEGDGIPFARPSHRPACGAGADEEGVRGVPGRCRRGAYLRDPGRPRWLRGNAGSCALCPAGPCAGGRLK